MDVNNNLLYHLPTKLWECNVISRVCLSVILSTGGSHVTITHDVLDFTIQGSFPGPSPGASLYMNQAPSPGPCTTTPFVPALSPSPTVQDSRHGHVQYCSTWISLYRDFPLTCSNIFKLDIIVKGPLPRHHQTCSLQSTHGWQVGGWHPTVMFSC